MTVDALGWTLLHFVWQGALAGAVLAVLETAFRRATPQVRYVLAAGTLLTMLLAPVVTFQVVRGSLQPTGDHETVAGSVPLGATTSLVVPVAAVMSGRTDFQALRGHVEPLLPALVGLWGSGVLLLSLRTLGGWALTRRLKRAGLAAVPPALESLLMRLVQVLRVSAPVRLFESALVEVPTVVGWLRPVILLPARALSGLSREQLELILAHELAHIRRRDYLVNLVQTAAETLLFYHPAVWWVSHRMRVEREHCCDDLAVAACGNAVTYAQALAEMEERRSGMPALALAANGGSLLARVARLVGAPQHLSRPSRGLPALLALAALGVALGAGSLVLAGSSVSPAGSALGLEGWLAVAAKPASLAASAPLAEPAASAGSAEPRRAARPQGEPNPSPSPTAESRAFPLPRILEMARSGITPEYIDAMAAIGYPSLTADELIALRSQGVGPEYVQALAEQGYQGLSPEQLVMLRSQGVSDSFARELKEQGLSDLSVSDLVQLRSQGVSAEYVAELKRAGHEGLSVSKLIGLRSQGVSGEFVSELKALGYDGLSTNRLIALRSNGVTPEYVKELGNLGYRGLDVTMLIGLRSQGVTPEYVRGLKEAGYQGLPAGALIELRSAGVSEEYVQELKQAGVEGLSVQELIELRSEGVSPELVKRLRNRR